MGCHTLVTLQILRGKNAQTTHFIIGSQFQALLECEIIYMHKSESS